MVDYLLLNRTHSVAVYVSAHWWKVCNFMVMDIVYVKVLLNFYLIPLILPLVNFHKCVAFN
jgi:hypothetical protein